MQAYSKAFARVYNLRWNQFADMVAPRLDAFFEEHCETPTTMLDLCCGSGRMIRYFAKKGFTITGIDLSENMLKHARENNKDFIRTKQVTLKQSNAADFTLNSQVQLAVSTYDSLNHIPDTEELRNVFNSVFRALRKGGYFIFDLNTESGLRASWGNISVREMQDTTIIIRGLFDEERHRSYTRMSGFLLNEQGTWDRFDEVIYNTAFCMKEVGSLLEQTGFTRHWFAHLDKLDLPLTDPESQPRVFVVAIK